ncbi:hypothetical protein K0M31_015085 [Melipona bicolor]|uniref:Uncharacterized protein n=1 Tax=Melipona bicolor TaxID=60889 RepID=A0AA40FG39_9HYME|nr:hypothetical protein K0M31_015085 [Melipona bicolor]
MASDSVQRCECTSTGRAAIASSPRTRRQPLNPCVHAIPASPTHKETAGRRAKREREREREKGEEGEGGEEEEEEKEEEEEEEEEKKTSRVVVVCRASTVTRAGTTRERKKERGLLSRVHGGGTMDPKEPRLRSLLNFLLGAAGRAEPSGMRECRQKPTKRDGERR